MVFKEFGENFANPFLLIFLATFKQWTMIVFELKNLFAFQLCELQILILVLQNVLEDLARILGVNIDQSMLTCYFVNDAFLKCLYSLFYLSEKSLKIDFFEARGETFVILAQMVDYRIKLPSMNELMFADLLFMLIFAAALSADGCYFGTWVFAAEFVDDAVMWVAECQHIVLFHWGNIKNDSNTCIHISILSTVIAS